MSMGLFKKPDVFWSCCNSCNRQEFLKKYREKCPKCNNDEITYLMRSEDKSIYKISKYSEIDMKFLQMLMKAIDDPNWNNPTTKERKESGD